MAELIIALRDVLVVTRRRRGGEWASDERLAGMRPKCLAADPRRPGRIWCGTMDHGLQVSDDAGDNWRGASADAVPERRVTAVAVARGEAVGGDGVVYTGTQPSAIYRSVDDGEHWERLTGLNALASASTWSFPPQPETHHVRWIEPDPHRPGRLFACIEAGALVRSDDGGRTWRDRVAGAPIDTHTLATHGQAPGRLYSAAGDGYFESDDAGSTWRSPEDGLRHRYLFGVAVDPADPDTVIVSASAGPRSAYQPASASAALYRRVNGEPWREVTRGLPANDGTTVSVLLAPSPGEFWALNNRGVFRSVDAALAWAPVPVPWPDAYTRRDVVAAALIGR